jgi:hypothetical protein
MATLRNINLGEVMRGWGHEGDGRRMPAARRGRYSARKENPESLPTTRVLWSGDTAIPSAWVFKFQDWARRKLPVVASPNFLTAPDQSSTTKASFPIQAAWLK